MKSKNNSIFLQTRHRLDVSIAMKSSQAKHWAQAIATTARYVFGPSMWTWKLRETGAVSAKQEWNPSD